MTGEDAVPPPTLTQTFSWADGELVGCDYQWMTGDEAFIEEMSDGYVNEPRPMLVETWERTKAEVRMLFPSNASCGIEDGEGDPCEAEATHWAKEGDTWHPLCTEHKNALGVEPLDIEAPSVFGRDVTRDQDDERRGDGTP